jgi:hypothetical protein
MNGRCGPAIALYLHPAWRGVACDRLGRAGGSERRNVGLVNQVQESHWMCRRMGGKG